MGKSLDVLGVGIAAVDDLLFVDDVPAHNLKHPVREKRRAAGGLAATAMAAAARLGGRAAYVARFGTDELSNYMMGQLRSQGVLTDHIIPDAAGRPYHSVIVVDRATGSRTAFYDCREFKQPTAADLPDELIRSAKVFFVDFLAEPVPFDLAAKARRLGVPVVADVEGRSEKVGTLLELCDYVVVSEEFAQWRTGQSDLAAACAALAQVRRMATVVTAGKNGCYWTTAPDQTPVHVPAFKVEAVDSTGCGDTYHGAFAYAVARGWGVEQAVLLASACGALKASGCGGKASGWAALPDRGTVGAFLAERRGQHPAIPGLLTTL